MQPGEHYKHTPKPGAALTPACCRTPSQRPQPQHTSAKPKRVRQLSVSCQLATKWNTPCRCKTTLRNTSRKNASSAKREIAQHRAKITCATCHAARNRGSRMRVCIRCGRMHCAQCKPPETKCEAKEGTKLGTDVQKDMEVTAQLHKPASREKPSLPPYAQPRRRSFGGLVTALPRQAAAVACARLAKRSMWREIVSASPYATHFAPGSLAAACTLGRLACSRGSQAPLEVAFVDPRRDMLSCSFFLSLLYSVRSLQGPTLTHFYPLSVRPTSSSSTLQRRRGDEPLRLYRAPLSRPPSFDLQLNLQIQTLDHCWSVPPHQGHRVNKKKKGPR